MKTCKHPTCNGTCRREKKPKVRARLRPVSKKRESLNKLYSAKRIAFLRGKVCKVCSGQATDVHHMKGRNGYFLDEATWLSVCRPCHVAIENKPEWAREQGYSDSRLNSS